MRNDGLPFVIIAQTVKGKGIAELEGKVESHYCGLLPEIAEKYLGGEAGV